MLYCYHCGKRINPSKIENKKSSYFDLKKDDHNLEVLQSEIDAFSKTLETLKVEAQSLSELQEDKKALKQLAKVNIEISKVEEKITVRQEKIKAINSLLEIDENTKICYICPRCGHVIHEGMDEEERKELSRASHALVQRGSNHFAAGMAMNATGIILLIIGILFLVLAFKPSQGFKLQTNCAEFIVFIALTALSVILLGFGVAKTIIGISNRRHYSKLLKDLNNKTFVQ